MKIKFDKYMNLLDNSIIVYTIPEEDIKLIDGIEFLKVVDSFVKPSIKLVRKDAFTKVGSIERKF